MKRCALVSLTIVAAAALTVVHSQPAEEVTELRLQKVGKLTYFHVRLKPPADFSRGTMPERRTFIPWEDPGAAPRLVPMDDKTRLVHERAPTRDRGEEMDGPLMAKDKDGRFPDKGPAFDKDRGKARNDGESRQRVAVQGLEFVGRCDGTGKAKFTLLYPARGKQAPKANTPAATEWREREIILDFDKAKAVAVPKQAAARKEKLEPGRVRDFVVRDDLEGLWAVAAAERFRFQGGRSRQFAFNDFAAQAISRKYGVRAESFFDLRMGREDQPPDDVPDLPGRGPSSLLYNLTTGASAITESLQMRRMTPARGRPRDEERSMPVSKLRGIDIAEHPWEKMIGDKKPAPEPLAALVPADNYYFHFKQADRLAAFSQVLAAWGGNVLNSYDLTSRDHRFWHRYERQLCLDTTALSRTLTTEVIAGIAISGSDAYLREGSDLTILFSVKDAKAFAAAVDPLLAEARQSFGKSMQESTSEHQGVTITSVVSPLREVSQHRATIGDVVMIGNSSAGLRRLIDVAKGKRKALSDSLDFRYMRTVFRHDDKDEDGFGFLSDAFIRNLVGPASKIKQRRRYEAIASLHMLTQGALLTQLDSGTPAKSTQAIFDSTTLAASELPMPEGKPATWSAEQGVAVSSAYNTIHFTTPLVELPLDNVTPTEAQEYEQFRLEYLGLWRQFFDPIGFRVAMKDGEVKLDTYILPLIENSAYNNLRRVTGSGSVRIVPSAMSAKTLFSFILHLSKDERDRRGWFGGFDEDRAFGLNPLLWLAWAIDPVGEWLQLRLDDSPNFSKLLEIVDRQMQGERLDTEEVARLIWTLPVAVGFDVKNKLTLAAALTAARTSTMMSAPGLRTWGPLEKEYKGVPIVRIQATERGGAMFRRELDGGEGQASAFRPTVYYADVDGALQVTLNEDMMRRLIDESKQKQDPKAKAVEVASSLYLAPGAAVEARGLIRRLLERGVHDQALTALPVWETLYAAGVVDRDATAKKAADQAYQFLGYVPISPDGTAFRYDAKTAEVINDRHGSLRKPVQHRDLLATSPVSQLFEALQSVRADLRFREDGIHTVLSLKPRKP